MRRSRRGLSATGAGAFAGLAGCIGAAETDTSGSSDGGGGGAAGLHAGHGADYAMAPVPAVRHADPGLADEEGA
jgi:hypothetical protein